MVKCLKLKKEFGEKARQFLIKKGWIDTERRIGKTERYLIIPLLKDAETEDLLKHFKSSIEERNLEIVKNRSVPDLRESLSRMVPKDQNEHLRRSFDIVGDIAILDVPKELAKLERSIGWTVLRTLPNIKVVAKKADKTAGTFRIRKIKVIGGEKRTHTTHREFDLKMDVDLNKSYFSIRLGNERLRIAKQIKANEKVLVMFAGVGPFALVAAKHQPKAEIWAIELNPAAFTSMKSNIRKNMLSDRVLAFKGDVENVAPRLGEKFDRIIMVLPETAHNYLETAINVAKKGAIIHLFQFASKKDLPKIKARAVKLSGNKVKVLRAVKCGAYAPYVDRYCLDLKVK